MAFARSHVMSFALTLLLVAFAPVFADDAAMQNLMVDLKSKSVDTAEHQAVEQTPVSQVAAEASLESTDSKPSLLSAGNSLLSQADAEESPMQNLLADLKSKSVDATEPHLTTPNNDQVVEQTPVSQIAAEAPLKSTESKPSLLSAGDKLQTSVDVEGSAMQNMLADLTNKKATDGAEQTLVAEDGQGSLPSSALLSSGETNTHLLVADSADVADKAPRESTLQRVYAALVGKKERMAKPEYGLNIQRRLPDPIHVATVDEEPVDIRSNARISLLKKDRQAIAAEDSAQDEGVSLMQLGALLSRGRSSNSVGKERHQEL